jgi:hypothetical protein
MVDLSSHTKGNRSYSYVLKFVRSAEGEGAGSSQLSASHGDERTEPPAEDYRIFTSGVVSAVCMRDAGVGNKRGLNEYRHKDNPEVKN